MNPTQLYCANCKGELPKVGGIEIREHREDGKTAYYTCNKICAHRFIHKLLRDEASPDKSRSADDK